MVSLWGSNKRDEDEPQPEEEADQGEQSATSSRSQPPPPPRQSEDANERTRLLPRHEHGVGYLSPDDPAVSPELALSPELRIAD